MLDILNILFCTPFLLYTCYSDFKKRRVINDVWLIMLCRQHFLNNVVILYSKMYINNGVPVTVAILSKGGSI